MYLKLVTIKWDTTLEEVRGQLKEIDYFYIGDIEESISFQNRLKKIGYFNVRDIRKNIELQDLLNKSNYFSLQQLRVDCISTRKIKEWDKLKKVQNFEPNECFNIEVIYNGVSHDKSLKFIISENKSINITERSVRIDRKNGYAFSGGKQLYVISIPIADLWNDDEEDRFALISFQKYTLK